MNHEALQFKSKKSNFKALGKAFWKLVEHYGLKRKEQALLLGINNNTQRLLDLQKKSEVPDDVDKCFRVGLLLGIHKNLRILYPENREIVYAFMKSPWYQLQNKSPLEFIAEDETESLLRLATIGRMLDITRTTY